MISINGADLGRYFTTPRATKEKGVTCPMCEETHAKLGLSDVPECNRVGNHTLSLMQFLKGLVVTYRRWDFEPERLGESRPSLNPEGARLLDSLGLTWVPGWDGELGGWVVDLYDHARLLFRCTQLERAEKVAFKPADPLLALDFSDDGDHPVRVTCELAAETNALEGTLALELETDNGDVVVLCSDAVADNPWWGDPNKPVEVEIRASLPNENELPWDSPNHLVTVRFGERRRWQLSNRGEEALFKVMGGGAHIGETLGSMADMPLELRIKQWVDLIAPDSMLALKVRPTEAEGRDPNNARVAGTTIVVGVGSFVGRRVAVVLPAGVSCAKLSYDGGNFREKRYGTRAAIVLDHDLPTKTTTHVLTARLRSAGDETIGSIDLVVPVQLDPLGLSPRAVGDVRPVLGIDVGTSATSVAVVSTVATDQPRKAWHDLIPSRRVFVKYRANPGLDETELSFFLDADCGPGEEAVRSLKMLLSENRPVFSHFYETTGNIYARYVIAMLGNLEVRHQFRVRTVLLTYPPMWTVDFRKRLIVSIKDTGKTRLGLRIEHFEDGLVGQCCETGCRADQFSTRLFVGTCDVNRTRFDKYLNGTVMIGFSDPEPLAAARYLLTVSGASNGDDMTGTDERRVTYLVVDMGAGTTDLATVDASFIDSDLIGAHLHPGVLPTTVLVSQDGRDVPLGGDSLDRATAYLIATKNNDLSTIRHAKFPDGTSRALDLSSLSGFPTSAPSQVSGFSDGLEEVRRIKEALLNATQDSSAVLQDGGRAVVATVSRKELLRHIAPYLFRILLETQGMRSQLPSSEDEGATSVKVLYVGNSYVPELHVLLNQVAGKTLSCLNNLDWLAHEHFFEGAYSPAAIERFASTHEDCITALNEAHGGGAIRADDPKQAVARGVLEPVLYAAGRPMVWKLKVGSVLLVAPTQKAPARVDGTGRKQLTKMHRRGTTNIAVELELAASQYLCVSDATNLDELKLADPHADEELYASYKQEDADATVEIYWSSNGSRPDTGTVVLTMKNAGG